MTQKEIQKAIHFYLLTLMTEKKKSHWYWHYQNKLSTKIINQPDPPNDHPADWHADFRWGFGWYRDYACAPDTWFEGDFCRRSAHVLQTPAGVSWMDRDGTIPWNGKNSRSPPRLTSQFLIGGGNTVSLNRNGSQEIGSLKGPTGYVEVRNAQPFKASINGNSANNEDPVSTFSNIIGWELSHDSIADIYLRCWLNFTCDAVLNERPNFMSLGISAVHTSNELLSFSIPATRIGRPIYGSNWLHPGHIIGEVTADRMIGKRSEQNYSSKNYFEIRRKTKNFEQQNISASQPPLDSTPFGTNTINGTTSPND